MFERIFGKSARQQRIERRIADIIKERDVTPATRQILSDLMSDNTGDIVDGLMTALDKALRTAGYKIVPLRPTEKMLSAPAFDPTGKKVQLERDAHLRPYVWAAMLESSDV